MGIPDPEHLLDMPSHQSAPCATGALPQQRDSLARTDPEVAAAIAAIDAAEKAHDTEDTAQSLGTYTAACRNLAHTPARSMNGSLAKFAHYRASVDLVEDDLDPHEAILVSAMLDVQRLIKG